MAAQGYSIATNAKIPLTGDTPNIVEGLQGITLRQPSRVRVYLSRESVDVTCGVNIGGTQVLQTGAPAPLNATVGSMPKIQDDLVCEVFARPNDLIIISGANKNAAEQELRVLLQVMPIDDVILNAAIKARRSA